jgi:hypothetical protein
MADTDQQGASTYTAPDYTLDGARFQSMGDMQASGNNTPVAGGLPTASSASVSQAASGLPSSINNITQKQDALSGVEELMQQKEKTMNQIPWFQLASAFLTPGRTGSFGEALGGAAGALGKWEEMRQEQMLPMAKAKLDIAIQKAALQQQLEGQKYLFGKLGLGPVGGPVGGPVAAIPAATPMGNIGAQPAQPSMAPTPVAQAIPAAQPMPATQAGLVPEFTLKDVALAEESGDPTTAKVVAEIYKNQQAEKELKTKQMTAEAAAHVKANLEGLPPDLTIPMDLQKNLRQKYTEGIDKGDLSDYVKEVKRNGLPIHFDVDANGKLVPMSPEQIAAGAIRSTKQAELQTQADQKFDDAALQRMDSAHAILPHIEAVQQYAKSNPEAFNRTKSAGVYDSFLNLAQKGVSIPGVGSIGLDAKAADQAMQSLGKGKLSDDDLRVARIIAPHLAAIAFETIQGMPGARMSNQRQQLIENLKPSAEDDSQSLRLKAESLKYEKLADIEKAHAWGEASAKGMTSKQFLLSPEYNKIENELLKKQTDLAAQVTSILGSKPRATQKTIAPTTPRVSPAAGFTQRFKERNKAGGTQ